jgi:hypothetical protein
MLSPDFVNAMSGLAVSFCYRMMMLWFASI